MPGEMMPANTGTQGSYIGSMSHQGGARPGEKLSLMEETVGLVFYCRYIFRPESSVFASVDFAAIMSTINTFPGLAQFLVCGNITGTAHRWLFKEADVGLDHMMQMWKQYGEQMSETVRQEDEQRAHTFEHERKQQHDHDEESERHAQQQERQQKYSEEHQHGEQTSHQRMQEREQYEAGKRQRHEHDEHRQRQPDFHDMERRRSQERRQEEYEQNRARRGWTSRG